MTEVRLGLLRSYASEDADLAIHRLCGGDLDRPVVIAGNGPSMTLVDRSRVPPDALVLRTNFFFLEQDQVLGDRVDGFFWSVDQPALHRRLFETIRADRYEIRAFFSPLWLQQSRSHPGNPLFEAAFQPWFDHWSILAKEPAFARAVARRPLPTQGMQMLATVVCLGFREIYLAGVDLYQDLGVRYAYPVPDDLKVELDLAHTTPGYEDAHSLETDLEFLDTIIAAAPSLSINLLTPSPLLEERYAESGVIQ